MRSKKSSDLQVNNCIIKQLGICAFVMFLLLLSGCGNNERSVKVKQKVALIKARPAEPIEPLPTLRTVRKETYQAKTLKDPFERPLFTRGTGAKPDLNRPKEPLEVYALDSLKMVGTITQNNHYLALITAPDRTVYTIAVGQHMGTHFGKVTKITDDKVDLLESVEVAGQWQKRKAELSLNP